MEKTRKGRHIERLKRQTEDENGKVCSNGKKKNIFD